MGCISKKPFAFCVYDRSDLKNIQSMSVRATEAMHKYTNSSWTYQLEFVCAKSSLQSCSRAYVGRTTSCSHMAAIAILVLFVGMVSIRPVGYPTSPMTTTLDDAVNDSLWLTGAAATTTATSSLQNTTRNSSVERKNGSKNVYSAHSLGAVYY